MPDDFAHRLSGRGSQRAVNSLAARAYRQVKQDILSGRLLPGQIFLGARLAETLRMSRTPVHEALKTLSRDGLVQVIPRVGYVVSPVTVNDVHEIFQLRLVLETMGAELAAARATPRDIELLKRFTVRGRPKPGGNSDALFVQASQAHRDFHLLIASLSGSRRLVDLIGNLLDESQRILAVDPLNRQHVDLLGLPSHLRMIRAIEAHDRREAVEAVVSHLHEAQSRIMAALMPEPVSMRTTAQESAIGSGDQRGKVIRSRRRSPQRKRA